MAVKLGGCAQVTRILFILLNILFLLLGIGIIAGGSVLVATGRGLEVFNGVFSAVGIAAIIIIVGIFTFIVSAIAILGAIFKSRILLGIYLIVVVLIILLEVAAAIVGIVKRGELGGTLDGVVEGLFDNYDSNRGANDTIDFFQKYFKCCGWENYTDFTNRSLSLPESCDCNPPNSTGCIDVDNQNIWGTPCRGRVISILTTYVAVVIAVAIIFALIELVAVLCACGLCCCIHRAADESNYTKV